MTVLWLRPHQVASQAVASMPAVLIFPLFPFVVEVVFLLYWLAVCALLYSAGEIVMTYRGEPPAEYLINPPAEAAAPPPPPPADESLVDTVDNAVSEVFLSVDAGFNITDAQCYADANCAYQLSWNNTLQYMGIYHLFGLLWTLQFITGYSHVVIAGSISNFYWYSVSEPARFESPC